MVTKKRRHPEPEQTRVARRIKQLGRRKTFSLEDIRAGVRAVAPGTVSATLAKMRDLGYLARCRDKAGQAGWKALRPLQEDRLEEVVKAVNKYSSLLSVMYRFRLNGAGANRKRKALTWSDKTATLLQMLEEERERAKSRQRTLTRVYNAIARLQ